MMWHVVRKDLRRFGLAVGLWLAVMIGQAAQLLSVAGDGQATTQDFVTANYAVGVLAAVEIAVGFLLAAWLVMEDGLVGAEKFWMTRPLGGARLLGAKLTAAALMFGALPVAVMTPVWLGAGFSTSEWAEAARGLVLQQAIPVAVAFALAAVTSNSGQFLVRAIALGLAMGIAALTISWSFGAPGAANHEQLELQASRMMVALVVLGGGGLVATVHQFLTRQTRRTLGCWCGLVALAAGAVGWWPWNFSAPAAAGGRKDGEGLRVAVESAPAESGEKRTIDGEQFGGVRLQVAVTGVPAGSLGRVKRARIDWQLDEARVSGPLMHRQSGGEDWTELKASQLAGAGAPVSGELSWTMAGFEPAARAERLRTQPCGVSGVAEVALVRGRLLGELRWSEDAALRVDGSRTRVMKLGRRGSKFVARLEEWDAWPAGKAGTGRGVPWSAEQRPAEDVFVVMNRGIGFAQVARVVEVGGVASGGLFVGQRELEIEPPMRRVDGRDEEIAGWERNATIVKVRFAEERNLSVPLVAVAFARTN